jgi:hypothetical protein
VTDYTPLIRVTVMPPDTKLMQASKRLIENPLPMLA